MRANKLVYSAPMEKVLISPEELSNLIGLTYDSAFEDPQWKSLIDRITQLFPGIGGIVYGTEGDTVLPEYAHSALSQLFVEPFRIDFGINGDPRPGVGFRDAPNGHVSHSREFMDEETFLATRLYQDLLRPVGFRHSVHLKLDTRGERSAVIGFPIPDDPVADARIYDPLYKLILLLSPHVVRALQLARALALAGRSTEVYSRFLDGIILPMIVTDAQGKFLFGNAAGRRVLERGTPLSMADNGRIVLNDLEDSRRLQNKIADVDRNLAPGGLRIVAEPVPVLLSITPFRASMHEASAIDRHLLSEEPMFAIFIGQTELDAISTALLEDVFDLTPREAEVCKSLLLGASAADIAVDSGRSLKTVRNQIQIVYQKVGVSSNVALIDSLSVFRTVSSMFEDRKPKGAALSSTP
ncbi:helix-turn-helix transcriptional regulator [Yoonia algicola]|uniref:Helix-turn-helix transcriptional regulator n=1 Tax=Yoonia algicola TaxID=3137368 RepID=A0AAN0NIG8_9RHOB